MEYKMSNLNIEDLDEETQDELFHQICNQFIYNINLNPVLGQAFDIDTGELGYFKIQATRILESEYKSIKSSIDLEEGGIHNEHNG